MDLEGCTLSVLEKLLETVDRSNFCRVDGYDRGHSYALSAVDTVSSLMLALTLRGNHATPCFLSLLNVTVMALCTGVM